MYKYLFFIIFGILLYLFLNGVDSFSVGIPEYLLTINDGNINIVLSDYHEEAEWAMNENGPLSPSNPVIMVDENRYYVYGDNIDDARRNYAVYIESMQSMAGGTGDSGSTTTSACSVPISVSNLEVRVGFEIEACFSNKPGQRRGIAGNYTICNFTNSDGSIIVPEEYGNIVQFLTTTRADDSLFKGVFEMTGQCKSENDCNVELIINNDKHVFFDGNNFSVDESEFKTSIQDWLDNNITSCGNRFNEEPSGPNPRDNKLLSTCSVHLHISVPSLETKYKDLFKILVFYLWFTEYQDMLKSKNPNYVTVGKRYSSPYKSLSEIDFPLPDASQITTMVSDPDSNRDMIQTFVNTLPGQIRDDSGHSRGTQKSNVIIVNTKFGDLYPHFEFRGHYDLMKSISSPNPTVDLVYEHLKNYTHSIWEVLNEAHNMLK